MPGQLQSIYDNVSWDVIAMFGLHGGVLLYGLLNRRNHLLSIVFSLYISQVIFEHFRLLDPFLKSEKATASDVFYFESAFYLVLIVLIASVIYKKVFEDGGPRIKFWKIILMVIAIGGLFVSSFLRLLPAAELYQLSPLIEKLFVGSNQVLLWLLLPILAMLVLIRRA